MATLSLCDGIATARVAIPQGKYYASEIDSYAIAIAEKNHNNIIQVGDIKNWREWDIPWHEIDLIIAGTPCQDLSIANNNATGLSGEKSSLFYSFVDILNYVRKINPEIKFLLENVNTKTKYHNIISELLGVQPVRINSNLVSAQNRDRFYWFNWDMQPINNKYLRIIDIIDKKLPYTECYKQYNYKETKNYIQFDVSGKGYNSQQDRAYYIHSRFSCLPAARAATKIKITNREGKYRNLTLQEVEKLQTLPVGYTTLQTGFSLNKSLSCIGNGMTLTIIKEILKWK